MASPGVDINDATGVNQKALSNVLQFQAQQYFNQAANQIVQGIREGTDAYNTALRTASDQMQLGYQQQLAEAQPYSNEAKTVSDEYLRMLGITPSSKASALSQRLDPFTKTLVNAPSDLKSQIDQYNTAYSQLANVDKLSSDQRAALKNSLASSLGNIQSGAQTRIQSLQDSLNKDTELLNLAKMNTYNWDDARGDSYLTAKWDPSSLGANSQDVLNQIGSQLGLSNGSPALIKETLTNRINTAQGQINALNPYKSTMDQINTVNSNFETEWNPGYTGQQVSEKLSQTPGFQFNLDQGTQAIQRSAAARGSLQSGNTLQSLQQFGQQLANNTYQTYLGNLSSTYNQLSPYQGAVLDILGQRAASLAQTTSNIGGNAYNSSVAIGQAYGGASNQIGSFLQQRSTQLLDQSFQAMEAFLNRAASGGNTATMAASSMVPSLLSYSLANRDYATKQRNSQQAYNGAVAGGMF